MLEVAGYVGVGLAGFVVGVASGETLRMVWAPFLRRGMGHTQGMARRPRPRIVLLVLVMILLVSNGLLGVLLIVARAQTNDSADARDRLVACISRYNAAQTKALVVRDERAKETGDAARVLWTSLRATLGSGNGTTPELIVSIDEYLRVLNEAKRSRVDVPYPPADQCRVPATRGQ